MKTQIINNSASVKEFSSFYPYLNKYLVENGDMMPSRNGMTKELLNFKLEINNPYKRCVGNNNRGMNIAFLLAEAIWIFAGQKDVSFLDDFNARMKDYSDDGLNFNAPYGFRIRHHGVYSFGHNIEKTEENKHGVESLENGFDQLEYALKLLSTNHDTRRAVLQIWNSEFDCMETKDIPCNDLVFLKIRDKKLHLTVSNRSNDLHWGLPTNIFQFGFMGEIISSILNIEYGKQNHNSDSLHFYVDNPIANNMFEQLVISNGNFEDIYSHSENLRMDFNFSGLGVNSRLSEIDFWLNVIIRNIRSCNEDAAEISKLKDFSKYLFVAYKIAMNYKLYKLGRVYTNEEKAKQIKTLDKELHEFRSSDLVVMAKNYYVSLMTDNADVDEIEYPLGTL